MVYEAKLQLIVVLFVQIRLLGHADVRELTLKTLETSWFIKLYRLIIIASNTFEVLNKELSLELTIARGGVDENMNWLRSHEA